jgi:transposase
MIDEDSLQERQAAMLPHLDERRRRLFAAAEAKAAGYGGIAAVSRVTRIAASTIGRGLKDLEAPTSLPAGRVRRPGGGRKPLRDTNSRLLDDLKALVEPDARGDPMSPLRWTCKSLRRLAAELNKLGHKISHTVVGELLKEQKFSLQANCKTKEGSDNPDRDRQFRFINEAVETALAENQPVISVDTKRRSWSATLRTPGANGGRKATPRKCASTTF